jgi:hypothetical protein
MTTAAKVAQAKESRPELYCPGQFVRLKANQDWGPFQVTEVREGLVYADGLPLPHRPNDLQLANAGEEDWPSLFITTFCMLNSSTSARSRKETTWHRQQQQERNPQLRLLVSQQHQLKSARSW